MERRPAKPPRASAPRLLRADGSLETDSDHGDLTGVHVILSDGGSDTVREQRAAALLKTGFFHGASR
jgi:hypothetical protein